MINLKISRMTIQNFCGIKSLEIAPNGDDLAIFGDNATGKSTVSNAFAWLFTGKNAAGTADFDPAPLDISNGKIHNIETEVAVSFTDGTEYRRVLSEVWTKKRGEVTAQLTGTKTAYFKNGVPMKEKEFIADTDALFGGAEQFRMLTAVGYFPAVMDWKARRRLLLEMCGDVNDSDVISSKAELSELPEMLDGHSVDDFLKIVKSRKTSLKKEIDTIPARISENENALADALSDEDILKTTAEIKDLEQQEKELSAKIASYNTASAADELKQELERARTAYLAEYNKQISEYQIKVMGLSTRRDEIYSQRSPLLVKKAELPRKIDEMKKQRDKLVEQHKEVSSRVYSGGDECPFCHQPLPPEQIEKAISEFNLHKSEELAAISEKAKSTCSKEMIAEAESNLESVTEQADKLTEQ